MPTAQPLQVQQTHRLRVPDVVGALVAQRLGKCVAELMWAGRRRGVDRVSSMVRPPQASIVAVAPASSSNGAGCGCVTDRTVGPAADTGGKVKLALPESSLSTKGLVRRVLIRPA
jgi:hypothetical protein